MATKLTDIYNFAGNDGHYANIPWDTLVQSTSCGMSSDPDVERGDNRYSSKDYWAMPHRRVCGCCGAYAGAPDDDVSKPSNGILIAANNNTPEHSDDEYTVKRVETQNGILVVSVKHVR